jgi:hypothetical protein
MGTERLQAMVYVKPGPRSAHRMAACADMVEGRGWELLGVVFGEHGGDRWRDLVDQADIIVVYDLAELPPDRRPRVEAANEQPPDPLMPRPRRPEPPRSPRPRRLRD